MVAGRYEEEVGRGSVVAGEGALSFQLLDCEVYKLGMGALKLLLSLERHSVRFREKNGQEGKGDLTSETNFNGEKSKH